MVNLSKSYAPGSNAQSSVVPSRGVSEGLKSLPGSLSRTLAELVLPLICVLASAGLVFLVIVPGVASIRNQRETKVRREEELESFREKVRKLDTLSSQIRELERSLSLVTNALPDEDKIPELMTQLQGMADEAGVVVSNLQYGGGGGKGREEKSGEVESIRFQMGVEGEYPKIEGLFKLFEQASRAVLLDRFGLSTRKEASMSANLAVSSFFLAPPDKARIDTPITLDLSSSSFRDAMARVGALKVYEITVEKGEVGKENPFAE